MQDSKSQTAGSKFQISLPMCTEKYINPFTDFGFKLLFGTPANKEFLIDFLNSLFEGEEKIVDISYNNTEIFGKAPDDRKAIFDLYCLTDTGSHIIVEMQNAYQRYFLDRTIYYSSFPIQAVAKKGVWNYELPPIYTIAFLNFCMDDYVGDPNFKHTVKLMDTETKSVFYDKLTYIYLEMPKFNKTINNLNGYADCWLFVIKNLDLLNEKPKELRGKVFERFFREAEIANFQPEERVAYEASLKNMRDYLNTLKSAEEKGEEKGLEKGFEKGVEQGIEIGIEQGAKEKALLIASNLKSFGMPALEIMKATGLTEEEIESL